MKLCPKCKKVIPTKSSFCPNCGVKFEKKKLGTSESFINTNRESSNNTTMEKHETYGQFIGSLFGFLFSPKGRISRTQFWLFIIFPISFYALYADSSSYSDSINLSDQSFFVLLTLFFIISYIFVGIKRLHDISQSGWVIFISFIPFANFILLLFLLFKEGLEEKNNYGFPSKYNFKYIRKNKDLLKLLFILYFFFYVIIAIWINIS